MDDRKKRIGELEKSKRENAALLDVLLARLGEALLSRIPDTQDYAPEELAVYRRLQNDIAASQSSIQEVEEQVRKFKELEENIEAKEREDTGYSRELIALYGGLGKLVLDASADGGHFGNFCAPYRDQGEALLTKLNSLEDRLAELESREGGNVFTWIGKNTQGLVLRTFLTRTQENLEKLRRTIGERYSSRDCGKDILSNEAGISEDAEIEEFCAEIGRKRSESQALSRELADLREEKRKISGSFSAEGGPNKQIQNLKNHIIRVQDDLKALYRRIGAEAASVETERRQIIDSLILAEDRDALDNVERINQAIHDDETAIGKLRASLAIDDEKAKIEKYRRMIQDKRDKIVQAEKSIVEYEKGIGDSEASIEKLQELL